MADLYGTTAAPASWFADTLDPSVPPAGATMPVMPKRGFWGELGDALAGLGGVNAPAIREANFNKNLTATSEYKLRSAQTESALAEADQRRTEAMRGSMVNNMITKAQSDPNYKPGISDLLALATGAGDLGQGQLHQQELGFRDTLTDPAATPAAQFAAGQGVQGKVLPHMYDVGGETVNQTTDPNATFQTPAQHAHVVAEAALAGQRDRAGTNAAAVTNMSPAAAYNAAVRYNITGQLPPLGMNAGGLRSKILEYAANIGADSSWVPPELHGGTAPSLQGATDLATNPAAFAAGRGALVDQTKRLAQVQGAEQTAAKNLDLAAQQLALADQSGVPLFNSIQNKIRANLLGDPTVAAYREALIGARNEYARVVSMQMGSAGMTEGARHEAQILFPDNLAPEQFSAAVSTAKQQMANRTQALHEATSGVQQGLHGIQAGAAPATGPVDPRVQQYADQYLGGDVGKATAILRKRGAIP